MMGGFPKNLLQFPFLQGSREKGRITRDEFDGAFQRHAIYSTMVATEGWKLLEGVARSQMKVRVEVIMMPDKDINDPLEKQFSRGERSGLALLLATPRAIIEDANFTMELYRQQEKLDADFEEQKGDESREPAEGASSGTIGGFRQAP